jgi:hypothetical protein
MAIRAWGTQLEEDGENGGQAQRAHTHVLPFSERRILYHGPPRNSSRKSVHFDLLGVQNTEAARANRTFPPDLEIPTLR